MFKGKRRPSQAELVEELYKLSNGNLSLAMKAIWDCVNNEKVAKYEEVKEKLKNGNTEKHPIEATCP